MKPTNSNTNSTAVLRGKLFGKSGSNSTVQGKVEKKEQKKEVQKKVEKKEVQKKVEKLERKIQQKDEKKKEEKKVQKEVQKEVQKKVEKKEEDTQDEECSDYYVWYREYCRFCSNSLYPGSSPDEYLQRMRESMIKMNSLIKAIICGLDEMNKVRKENCKISAFYNYSFKLNSIDPNHPHFILTPKTLLIISKIVNTELCDKVMSYGQLLYEILVAGYVPKEVKNFITKQKLWFWYYKPQKVESLISDLREMGFATKTN